MWGTGDLLSCDYTVSLSTFYWLLIAIWLYSSKFAILAYVFEVTGVSVIMMLCFLL